MKQIFLVDDHQMLREGLIRLIVQNADWQICGEASSAAAAVESIQALSPDLVIMDLTLPDKSGIEVIKDLQTLAPGIRILVFSMHDEMLYAQRAIRAGAKGYIMKGAASGKLMEAINRVMTGEIYLSGQVSNQILNGLSGKRGPEQFGLERLTDRELEVFELLGHGKSTGEISDQLHISPKTVDAHRFNLKAKLSLPDAQALMREAILWVEFGGKSGAAGGLC
ncbi:MAG: response regulator transcription factor [Verrucomicrobiota bacterium]